MMADCPPRLIKSRQIFQSEQTETDGYRVVTPQASMPVMIWKLDWLIV